MQNITLFMCTWHEARNIASQKFHLTLGPGPINFQIWESDSC